MLDHAWWCHPMLLRLQLQTGWLWPQRVTCHHRFCILHDFQGAAFAFLSHFCPTASKHQVLAPTGPPIFCLVPPASTVHDQIPGLERFELPRNVAKCWQNKWFVAPSCRADPMRCIAVVSSGDGWGIREMMHKAFFYNMPVAFGTAISFASWHC